LFRRGRERDDRERERERQPRERERGREREREREVPRLDTRGPCRRVPQPKPDNCSSRQYGVPVVFGGTKR